MRREAFATYCEPGLTAVVFKNVSTGQQLYSTIGVYNFNFWLREFQFTCGIAGSS